MNCGVRSAQPRDRVKIALEFAYAGPEGQWLLPVQVEQRATIADAIRASGLEERVPALGARDMKGGIFGRIATLVTPLADGVGQALGDACAERYV